MHVDVTVTAKASPDRIWQCLVDPVSLSAWFGPHLALDARPGGSFHEVWQDGARRVVTSGTVAVFEPGRRMVLGWKDEDWPAETEVDIRIEPHPPGTRIHLSHRGWERLGEAATALAAAHRDGWTLHLNNLAAYAEGRG